MSKIIQTCFASAISEIRHSDIYLTVVARLFKASEANLNKTRVSMDFIDEIVANQDKYYGLPLCADVDNLTAGNYNRLNHLYDAKTGQFHSTMIGSFYRFEKEDAPDGVYLVGYARVLKRNASVCNAITELYNSRRLKFSFEIACADYNELPDDTLEIYASENNYLEGAAIVSYPACEEAVAMDLVAETEAQSEDEIEKGVIPMSEEAKVVVAEDEKIVDTNAEAENVVAEVEEKVPTEQSVVAEEVAENCNENETASKKEPEKEEEKMDPEEDAAPEKKEEEKEPEEEDAACKKKKCAEDEKSTLEMIKSLTDSIAELKREIAELKTIEQHKVEIAEEVNKTNPFMASDMNAGSKEVYSLLESFSDNTTTNYDLLNSTDR